MHLLRILSLKNQNKQIEEKMDTSCIVLGFIQFMSGTFLGQEEKIIE